jgi:hypothetical protein
MDRILTRHLSVYDFFSRLHCWILSPRHLDALRSYLFRNMLLVSFQVSFQVRSFARIPFSQHLYSLGAWLCFSFDYLGPIVIPSNRIIPGNYIIPLSLYVRARHPVPFIPEPYDRGNSIPSRFGPQLGCLRSTGSFRSLGLIYFSLYVMGWSYVMFKRAAQCLFVQFPAIIVSGTYFYGQSERVSL